MQENSAIQVHGLGFAYRAEEPVLENVTFTIARGSTAAIIGPNGSGKTTLLRLLLGLLTPQTGEVRVLGRPPALVRRAVAYVPQRFSFDRSFPITVLEFLQLSHPRCSRQRAADYLGHLGMAGTLLMRLGALSGGQLQRLLIERAMLGDPQVLFLDEPAAGIDVTGEKTFYQMILHLQQEHRCTIVMVSHELQVVGRYADLVLCINRRLVCQGAPRQVLSADTLKNLFGEEASIFSGNSPEG